MSAHTNVYANSHNHTSVCGSTKLFQQIYILFCGMQHIMADWRGFFQGLYLPLLSLSSSPPHWIFQLCFIHSFDFFGLTKPSHPKEIPILSVGRRGWVVWIISGTAHFPLPVICQNHTNETSLNNFDFELERTSLNESNYPWFK